MSHQPKLENIQVKIFDGENLCFSLSVIKNHTTDKYTGCYATLEKSGSTDIEIDSTQNTPLAVALECLKKIMGDLAP